MTGMRPSDRRNITWRCARIACVLVLNVALLAPIPLAQAAAVVSFVWSSISLTPLQQDDPQGQAAQTPGRNYAPRIKLLAGGIRELTFGEAIVAVTVLDPTVAAAETKADRGLVVTGLNAGETILIISGENRRSTYVIQVVRPPRASWSNVNEALRNESAGSFSGFYGLHFSPARIPRRHCSATLSSSIKSCPARVPFDRAASCSTLWGAASADSRGLWAGTSG
jgi:putative type II/III system pilus formation protein